MIEKNELKRKRNAFRSSPMCVICCFDDDDDINTVLYSPVVQTDPFFTC